MSDHHELLNLFDDPVIIERRVVGDWAARLENAAAMSGAAAESTCWDIVAELREVLGLGPAEEAKSARDEEYQLCLQRKREREENERRRREQIERARQERLARPRVTAMRAPHFYDQQED